MAWKTATYVVTLSDGTHRSIYAESASEAAERMARHVARHDDPRTVTRSTKWTPPKQAS